MMLRVAIRASRRLPRRQHQQQQHQHQHPQCLGVRCSFSTESVPEPVKPKRKFDPTHPELRVADFLERKSPLLVLSEGKVDRQPFLRGIFAGQFDEQFLTYPEVLEPSQVHSINELYERVKAYVDSLAPDVAVAATAAAGDAPSPPPVVVDTLRSLGVYGASLPKDAGGLGLTTTELMRLLEAFGRQPSLGAAVLAHHCTALSALRAFGTPEQQAHYVPKLASREWTSAFASLEERCGVDAQAVQTTIRRAVDDSFVLNGTKTFVVNGQHADVFVVICQLDTVGEVSADDRVSAVIVDRRAPGVHVSRGADPTLGLAGCGLATVTFREVAVPRASILGRPGDGSKVCRHVLSDVRLPVAALTLGTAREALNATIRHVIATQRYKKSLHELQVVRKRIAEMTADIYAMESAIYLTTAIVDVVNNPDYELEAVATRLFCAAAGRRVLDTCIDLHEAAGLAEYANNESSVVSGGGVSGGVSGGGSGGGSGGNGDLSRWLRDVRTLDVFDIPADMSRLLLSMRGVQYTGQSYSVTIQAMRDPLVLPLQFAAKVFSRYRQSKERPKLSGLLEQFVHPSLKTQCDLLEQCVKQTQLASERCLELFGAEITEQHAVLCRLADMGVDTYTLSAVLGRASRSYCIGLQNSDDEMLIGGVFAREVLDRVNHNASQIEGSLNASSLRPSLELAKSVVNSKRYCLEHPLTRNWD